MLFFHINPHTTDTLCCPLGHLLALYMSINEMYVLLSPCIHVFHSCDHDSTINKPQVRVSFIFVSCCDATKTPAGEMNCSPKLRKRGGIFGS